MNEVTSNGRRVRLLGYPFEVRSSLSRDKAKAALRKQKVSWLDPKRGPRGWILGSLLCLQWSALGERTGPVVYARIADDGLGSRVRGRAGLDVLSLGLIGLIAGVMMFSVYSLQTESFSEILLFDLVALLIPGAVLWLRLASPEDPEPLVRFVRRALETPTAASARPPQFDFDRTPVPSATLNINGRRSADPSEHDVAQAILAMKPDSFLIIDFGSNSFMQTVLEYDRFILEKCEGSDDELLRAKGDFERNDAIAVMTAYLRGSQSSEQIAWEKVPG